MIKTKYLTRSLIYITKSIILLALLFLLSPSINAWEVYVKTKSKEKKAVIWEKVNVSKRDLYLGPGGSAMRPDTSKITLLKEEKGGSSKKFRIKDAKGREWVAKVGNESQPETSAVRLIWALGYKTEINYLTPSLNIPGEGTFRNVRLEARPENVERIDRWEWKENQFSGSKEYKGLKIMMAFLNNWDIKNGNTIILDNGKELQYVVSDLGATFGNYGGNGLPIFWRIGRSKNNPLHYSKSKFIKGVEDGEIEFAINGRKDGIFDDIKVNEARWVTNLLLELSDKQIRDAFRAANYSQNEINILTGAVKNRILELDRATRGSLAKR